MNDQNNQTQAGASEEMQDASDNHRCIMTFSQDVVPTLYHLKSMLIKIWWLLSNGKVQSNKKRQSNLSRLYPKWYMMVIIRYNLSCFFSRGGGGQGRGVESGL